MTVERTPGGDKPTVDVNTIKGNSSIAVLVNDQPITQYDIKQRAALMRVGGASGGEKAATDELIDETLKMYEAAKRGVNVPDGRIDAAYASIANNLKMTPAATDPGACRPGDRQHDIEGPFAGPDDLGTIGRSPHPGGGADQERRRHPGPAGQRRPEFDDDHRVHAATDRLRRALGLAKRPLRAAPAGGGGVPFALLGVRQQPRAGQAAEGRGGEGHRTARLEPASGPCRAKPSRRHRPARLPLPRRPIRGSN